MLGVPPTGAARPGTREPSHTGVRCGPVRCCTRGKAIRARTCRTTGSSPGSKDVRLSRLPETGIRKYCGRNRVRTCDPSLVRRERTVWGRRLVSCEVPASCADRLGASSCVAQHLAALAPRLAPEISLGLLTAAPGRERRPTLRPSARSARRSSTLVTDPRPRRECGRPEA
jgi:hypothetical protein